MPSLRFAPYREIATEIAARLAAARDGRDPLAPWDEEVIVPSRGMAEAIAAELLTRLPRGMAGLQLHSLDDLAKRTLAANGQTPRVANDGERRLAMRIATRSVDDVLMSSRGIAAMLERSYRDVRDSGFTLADFTRRGTGGLRNPRRTELVVRAWTEYERLVGSLNAIDPADLLARATRAIDGRVKPQLIAGFYDMTGAQRQLAEALLRAERVAAIWVPSEAPFAEPYIRTITPYAEVVRDPALEIRRPRLDATAHNTRLDEIRAVAARIAGLLDSGVPAREIGIVARSLEPYDVRLLHRFGAEHGFAVTLGDDLPLAAHRIGRGALTLLRLKDRGFPRSEVLGLVRDGLLAKTRLDVDAADKETRRARIAGGTSEELRRMRKRTPVIDGYIALVAELEELTADVDLARLASTFRIETDADLAAAEKLDAIAALFSRLNGITSDAIDAIEQAVIPSVARDLGGRGSKNVPSAPPAQVPRYARDDNPAIWAGEVLRFRGRAFSHLFVLRMQDDVFPQRRTEDPLLPDADRRILGLREIGDGREEEQLLFSLLSESTLSDVHFSYASGDGFGKVLRPSRFVRGVASCQLPVAGATHSRQPATGNRKLQLIAKAGTKSLFDGYIGPIALDRPLSPTQLEDFGECPQKFLLKHVLGVQDVDHPERELQIHHRDKGILDHRVLEAFYKSMSADDFRGAMASLPHLPEKLSARLDQLIDDTFDDHERDVPPFNRTVRDIERRATKRILREFVIADLGDLAVEDLLPRHFEFRFGTKFSHADHPHPFIIETDGVPVRVEGTIDRIDVNETRYRIVDYKSGKALRHVNLGDKIDRGVRLQLALYAMAVAEFFQADPAHVSGAIKPLVQGEQKPDKFAFALEEKRETLLETLQIFIRAIVHGQFPAFPNANDADFNSCKYCPVNHSCRTKHDLDERYAVQQLRDPRTLLGGAPQ